MVNPDGKEERSGSENAPSTLPVTSSTAKRLVHPEKSRPFVALKLTHLALVPALLFLAIFYVYPLIEVLRISFIPGDLSQGAGFITALSETRTLRVVGFSFYQATLSTALTLLIGLPMAYTFARYHSHPSFRSSRIWQAIVGLPFVLPTVVVAAAFEAFLGARSPINTLLQSIFNLDEPPLRLMNTLTMILIAHVFYNVSVVVRLVGSFWALLGNQLDEAAASLGANPRQIFWQVTMAVARPAILAAAALTFLFTFTSFGTILLLGGPDFATIEVEIYNQTSQLLRLDIATSLALVQLAVTLLLSIVSAQLQSRASVPLEIQPERAPNRTSNNTRSSRVLIIGTVAFILIFIIAPLVTLLLRSIAWQSDNPLRFYLALNQNPRGSFFFVSPLIAVRNSVGIAALTAALALGMGLPLAYALADRNRGWLARLLDAFLLLPLGTSALTLGLGYLVAFDSPIDLRTSPLLLPLAHTLIALPFVVRTLLPGVRAINQTLRETAANLGASPLQVIRLVDVPLLMGPLLAALLFAFAISLGEFGASVLIARPEYPTMPLVIARFLGQPGALNYGQALAMSSVLMAVTVMSTLLIERLGQGSKEI